MMTKHLTALLVILFTLAACAPQPAPAVTADPPEPVATTASPPTPTTQIEVSPTAAAVMSDTPTAEPAATEASSLVTYQIVPEESQLSYAVDEEFFNEYNRFNTAIGVTSAISGTLLVDPQNPQNSQLGPIQVDISQFKSDNARRDAAIRDRFLQSSLYPLITFLPTQIEGLPDNYQDGQEINVKITGDVTIRDQTRPVTFEVKLVPNGETLTGEATGRILMSDFQFGPINIAGILKTNNVVNLTFTFVARPAQ